MLEAMIRIQWKACRHVAIAHPAAAPIDDELLDARIEIPLPNRSWIDRVEELPELRDVHLEDLNTGRKRVAADRGLGHGPNLPRDVRDGRPDRASVGMVARASPEPPTTVPSIPPPRSCGADTQRSVAGQ